MSKQAPVVEEGWLGPGRRDQRIEVLALSDDGLHVDLNQRGAYEWWYFDAHLDTGHTIVVFFHASNPNPGLQGKTGIEVVLLAPDGHRTQKFFAHHRSDFVAAKDRPEVTIGKNTIRVSSDECRLPVYDILVDEPGLGCQLSYTAEVNGWKPGTGFSHFGDMGYFAWVVPFARASVKGTITVDGREIEVTGIGYHDHNWLNFQFQRIIKYWMWGRVYSEHYTLAYAYIQCNESVNNHTVQVLMLAKGQEVIVSTGEFELLKEDFEYNSAAKHQFPKQIGIKVPGELEVTLNVRQILEAQDLLENFNRVLRFAAKHVLRLRPGYFRLASDFDLSVISGGETKQETGTTLHEIVVFDPIV